MDTFIRHFLEKEFTCTVQALMSGPWVVESGGSKISRLWNLDQYVDQ